MFYRSILMITITFVVTVVTVMYFMQGFPTFFIEDQDLVTGDEQELLELLAPPPEAPKEDLTAEDSKEEVLTAEDSKKTDADQAVRQETATQDEEQPVPVEQALGKKTDRQRVIDYGEDEAEALPARTSPQAAQEDVTVQAAQEDVTVQAAREDVTVQAAQKDVTVQAAQEDVTVQAAQEDVTVQKAQEDIAAQEVQEDIAAQKIQKAQSPPTEALPIEIPTFSVARINEENHAFFAGSGPADASLDILNKKTLFAQAKAGPDGDWVYLSDVAMEPDVYVLSLTARDAQGDEIARSKQVLILVVKDIVTDTTSSQEEKSQPLVVLTPRDTDIQAGASRRLDLPTSATADPIDALPITIETVDIDDSGDIAISGASRGSGTLLAYLNNAYVNQTTSTARYIIFGTQDLASGEHTVRVDLVDDQGGVIARAQTLIYYDKPEPEIHGKESQVLVTPGLSLWRISRRVYGKGARYTVIFEANREQIIDPDMIYPGQVFLIPDALSAP